LENLIDLLEIFSKDVVVKLDVPIREKRHYKTHEAFADEA
jgi:hypothetical protein